MNLFIKIENGQPKNHPAFDYNLIEAFGSIPNNWEAFVRVERPKPTIYQILELDVPLYAKVEGVWTDVWSLRNMTAEEKTAKQQAVIDKFNAREQAENWSAWTLDEDTCKMIPPITRPEPDQSKLVCWVCLVLVGAESNWKDTSARPVDNNQYKFDFFTWQWVELTP